MITRSRLAAAESPSKRVDGCGIILAKAFWLMLRSVEIWVLQVLSLRSGTIPPSLLTTQAYIDV
jgi:hypothetical protein